MKTKWSTACAAVLAIGVVCTTRALAQIQVGEAPATLTGKATCKAKFPGSFLDIPTGECWQCPSTHPTRTLAFPVTVRNACERPANTVFRRATGPEKGTGLIGTDCRRGWFFDLLKRKCYSCPSGYRRTLKGVDHPRACTAPAAWARAAHKGAAGCAAGSFRHGLTDRCYSCPSGYARNAVIADDLTKVKACTRITLALREATHAKFERQRNANSASRANLGLAAKSVTSASIKDPFMFDGLSSTLMWTTLEAEAKAGSGFKTISWLVSGGASAVVGYSAGYGFVMTKVGSQGRGNWADYKCAKTSSLALTAGLAGGSGVVVEAGLSGDGIAEGNSASNGWQVAVAIPPINAGYGLHWDTKSDAKSINLTFAPGFALDANLSEYVHTMSHIGKEVPCHMLTWGIGYNRL